jgi:monoamine oxidase
MSRTPWMRLLRRALQSNDEVQSAVAARPPAVTQLSFTRRSVLLTSAAATAGLGSAACGATPAAPQWDARLSDSSRATRVAVVGAGIAGLHCAWRLKEAGVDVTLFEASNRAGGRMFTTRDSMEGGQVAELGAELINSGHPVMLALAEELGQQLDDRTVVETSGIETERFFFGGRVVHTHELAEMWRPVAARMVNELAAAEADPEAFVRLDAQNILEWLDATGECDPTLREVLRIAYTAEYGLECEQQSVLNLMYLIDSATPEPFRILGDSDERWHVHAGNDAIPGQLATGLGDRLVLESPLLRVRSLDDGRVAIVVSQGGSANEFVFDHVVLAIPQTLLRLVDLQIADMPEAKLRSIREVTYGTNAKLMMQFRHPVWRTEHQCTGATYTDNGLGTGWDGSIGQPGEFGLFTNFVGGNDGLAMGEDSAKWQAVQRLAKLDEIYPGAAAAWNTRAVRFHWPSSTWARGSYLCYGPGQWEFYGVEGQRVGNLHFCGEHTSLDNQGYMEGGAESGLLVAAEILDGLGADVRPLLERMMGASAMLPQSTFRASRLTSPRWLARRLWMQRTALAMGNVRRRVG